MSIEKFAEMIRQSNNIVFFGGAGVSTESGVKDYRSKDGLYTTVKEYGVPPEVILSHDFFFEHTDIFYDFYRKYFISNAKPNKAHITLAELEKSGKLKAVITQNIDGLHQNAGSKNVIKLHGNAQKFSCSRCNREGDNRAILNEIGVGKIPMCKHCKEPMKPRVVLYGEMLYPGVSEAAVDAISQADMLIVGGTSLAVYPAASFVRYFKGKYIVMLNKSETDFDTRCDLIIREPIGKVFGKLSESLKNNLP